MRQRLNAMRMTFRWISFFHLFISFLWRVGPIAIAKREGLWVAHSLRTTRSFRFDPNGSDSCCSSIVYLRDTRVEHVTCTNRPHSQWICCFKGSIAFQLDDDEFCKVEGFLKKTTGVTWRRHGRDGETTRQTVQMLEPRHVEAGTQSPHMQRHNNWQGRESLMGIQRIRGVETTAKLTTITSVVGPMLGMLIGNVGPMQVLPQNPLVEAI
jgi:hypothetical protein